MGFNYDEAAEAKASTGRKPYLEANVDFKGLLITKAEFSSGYTGNKYLIEGRVLSAEAAEAGASVPPVGAERFHSIDLDNEEYGMANLMAFVEGLNGGPLVPREGATKGQQMRFLLGEEEVTEEQAKKTGKSAQGKREAFAVGMFIGNRTNAGPDVDKDGKPKKPFTYMNWYPVPDQNRKDVEHRKALLKAGKASEITLTTKAPAPAAG